MAFEPEQKFENPDGTSIVFNQDYFGRPIIDLAIAGPIARIVGDILLFEDSGSSCAAAAAL